MRRTIRDGSPPRPRPNAAGSSPPPLNSSPPNIANSIDDVPPPPGGPPPPPPPPLPSNRLDFIPRRSTWSDGRGGWCRKFQVMIVLFFCFVAIVEQYEARVREQKRLRGLRKARRDKFLLRRYRNALTEGDWSRFPANVSDVFSGTGFITNASFAAVWVKQQLPQTSTLIPTLRSVDAVADTLPPVESDALPLLREVDKRPLFFGHTYEEEEDGNDNNTPTSPIALSNEKSHSVRLFIRGCLKTSMPGLDRIQGILEVGDLSSRIQFSGMYMPAFGRLILFADSENYLPQVGLELDHNGTTRLFLGGDSGLVLGGQYLPNEQDEEPRTEQRCALRFDLNVVPLRDAVDDGDEYSSSSSSIIETKTSTRSIFFGSSSSSASSSYTQGKSMASSPVGAPGGTRLVGIAKCRDAEQSTNQTVLTVDAIAMGLNIPEALRTAIIYFVAIEVESAVTFGALIHHFGAIVDSPALVSKASLAWLNLVLLCDVFTFLCLLSTGEIDSRALVFAAISKGISIIIGDLTCLFAVWVSRRDSSESGSLWRGMSRLQTVLLLGMLFFSLLRQHPRLLAFVYASLWIPQIVQNVRHDIRDPFPTTFVLTLTLVRFFVPFLPLASSFADSLSAADLLGSHTDATSYDPMGALGIILWLAAQVAVIQGQRKYGARFFVPEFLRPIKYKYQRPLPDPDLLSSDCVVCMQSLGGGPEEGEMESGGGGTHNNNNKAEEYAVTPCNHVFHKACLEKWMLIRMSCPTCRATLPVP